MTVHLPGEVVGFHGTNRAAVSRLLAGNVRRSDQHFEWLGTGFYLWQDSPWRAQRWAVDPFGDGAGPVGHREAEVTDNPVGARENEGTG